MPPRRPTDRFSNMASALITEPAANTVGYQELQTGIGLGQGMGILIDQIDYYIAQPTIEEINNTTDTLEFGWTTSNQALSPADRRTVHYGRIGKNAIIGTPASGGEFLIMPLVYQFFPPMIIAAPRIYLGVKATSLINPSRVDSRLYFRYIELTREEYLEIAETFILVG